MSSVIPDLIPAGDEVKTLGEIHRGKRLAWNSFLNLGTGLFIVGLNLLFVPLMLRAFGTELYGVLSATWLVLANLAWLDFGFSRATARFVSQDLAIGRIDRAALWTWTAVLTQTFLGLVGAGILSYFAPFVVDHIHVQEGNRALVILTLRLFAFSIPIEFATRSMTGVLQAGQRFDWVNGLSLFNTISTFVAYGCGILLGSKFLIVIYLLFALRLMNLFLSYWAAVKILPSLSSFPRVALLPKSYWVHAVTMIKYGSWIAFASGVGPLLLYFDQWVISFVLGVALLPLYTIPSNAIGRLFLFPYSISSTLFPAFSALQARTDWERIDEYFVRANRYLLTAIMPLLFVLFIWAPELFRLWLGAELGSQVTLPFRVLVVGFGVGLLAPLSGTLLEAIGRPDVLVKLYLVELPFNIAIVWIFVKNYGIAGAALSYTVRTVLETIVLWIIIYRLVPLSGMRLLKAGFIKPFVTLPLFVVGAYLIRGAVIENWFDVVGSLLMLSVYGFCVFVFILDRRDRNFLFDLYRNRKERLVLAK
jgi:O-antigen/teichoic acid export membrane protein